MKAIFSKISKTSFNLNAFNFKKQNTIINTQHFNFTGPTETGHKYTTPYMKMKSIKPITPPGMDLKAPEDWTPKIFFEKIGGDTYNSADNFETLQEIFDNSNTEYLCKKGVPTKQRKYILRCVDFMRRGLLTFEYLERRKVVAPCRKLTRPMEKKSKKKKADEDYS